MIRDWYVYQLI